MNKDNPHADELDETAWYLARMHDDLVDQLEGALPIDAGLIAIVGPKEGRSPTRTEPSKRTIARPIAAGPRAYSSKRAARSTKTTISPRELIAKDIITLRRVAFFWMRDKRIWRGQKSRVDVIPMYSDISEALNQLNDGLKRRELTKDQAGLLIADMRRSFGRLFVATQPSVTLPPLARVLAIGAVLVSGIATVLFAGRGDLAVYILLSLTAFPATFLIWEGMRIIRKARRLTPSNAEVPAIIDRLEGNVEKLFDDSDDRSGAMLRP